MQKAEHTLHSSFRLLYSLDYPAWIRTRTKRTKISCATVTLPGNDGCTRAVCSRDAWVAERNVPSAARMTRRPASVQTAIRCGSPTFSGPNPNLSANAPSNWGYVQSSYGEMRRLSITARTTKCTKARRMCERKSRGSPFCIQPTGLLDGKCRCLKRLQKSVDVIFAFETKWM